MVQSKETPLHMAAMKGSSETVQLLLAAKGNADAEDNVSASPCANMMELVLSCVVDSCRTTPPHYTGLLRMETVRHYSCCSLQRAMSMLRTA